MELVYDGQWQKWVRPGLFNLWNTNCLGLYHSWITLLFQQKAPNYLLCFSAHLCLFTYSTFSKLTFRGAGSRWLLVCHEGHFVRWAKVAHLRLSLQLISSDDTHLGFGSNHWLDSHSKLCVEGKSNQLNILKRFNIYCAVFWKLFKQ